MAMQSVEVTCGECDRKFGFIVNHLDLIDWNLGHGKAIQHAFPYLTSNQRTLLQTDMCSDCWNLQFICTEQIGA